MLKTLVIVVGLVGCGGGGDKCERAYDKMAPMLANLKEKEEGKPAKDSKAKRAESIAECRADLKTKPELRAQLDCIIAISGTPTMETMMPCFKGDDKADRKESGEGPATGGADPAKSKAMAAEALTKMVGFKDKMCACKDKACADVVTAEMTAWSEDMAKNTPISATPNEEDMKKMTDVGTQFGECMTKAMLADPAAPAK